MSFINSARITEDSTAAKDVKKLQSQEIGYRILLSLFLQDSNVIVSFVCLFVCLSVCLSVYVSVNWIAKSYQAIFMNHCRIVDYTP